MTTKLWQPYSSTDVVVSDERWTEIEAAGNIHLPLATRSHLLALMTSYRQHIDGSNAAVRPGKVRPLLDDTKTKLRDAGTALMKLAAASPPEAHAAQREIQIAAAINYKANAGCIELNNLSAQMAMFVRYVEAAVERLPTDVGAPGDPYVGGLLVVAQMDFLEAGGRGRYTAHAMQFLHAICDVVGYRVQSEAALRQTLKGAWKKVRAVRPT